MTTFHICILTTWNSNRVGAGATKYHIAIGCFDFMVSCLNQSRKIKSSVALLSRLLIIIHKYCFCSSRTDSSISNTLINGSCSSIYTKTGSKTVGFLRMHFRTWNRSNPWQSWSIGAFLLSISSWKMIPCTISFFVVILIRSTRYLKFRHKSPKKRHLVFETPKYL